MNPANMSDTRFDLLPLAMPLGVLIASGRAFEVLCCGKHRDCLLVEQRRYFDEGATTGIIP